MLSRVLPGLKIWGFYNWSHWSNRVNSNKIKGSKYTQPKFWGSIDRTTSCWHP